MTTFLFASAKAALVFFGYLGIHYLCAWVLPLSPAWYTICANTAVVLLFVLGCLFRKQNPLSAAGARRMPKGAWLTAIGVGAGLCLMVRLVMLTVQFPSSWMESYTERVELVQQAPAWVMTLSSVIVAPLAEELIFRGLMYRHLKESMTCVMAALVSCAAFALLHGTVVWVLYTFVLGLMLVWLYEKTRSLFACIACHTVFNIVGQLPFVGIVPDAVTAAIFVAGAVILVVSLWYMRKTAQGLDETM